MNYKEELKKLAFGYTAEDIVATYTKDGKLLKSAEVSKKDTGKYNSRA